MPANREPNPLQPIQGSVARVAGTLRQTGRQRILVVDDDDDIRESVAQIVLAAGIGRRPDIVTAKSGPEAIRLMKHRFIDFILCDYHMGPMDGVSFVLAAQRIQPGVPCALMSGNPFDAAAHVVATGPPNVVFLPKPFEPSRVAKLLDEALGWRRET